MKDLWLVLVLATSSCLAAFGQVFLKFGVDSALTPLDWINLRVLLGLLLYLAGLVLWLYGLSHAPLHVVYPFAMLTFVLVGLLGMIIFGERPGAGVASGWLVVMLGIGLIYWFS